MVWMKGDSMSTSHQLLRYLYALSLSLSLLFQIRIGRIKKRENKSNTEKGK